ncbi:MAG: hypothetical protein EWV42_21635 [Microcystis panniformis Mp_GB_SS_20050300_S99D]|nr:MAG: hypothetical protein EWV42_21635 [Microcystis panniformis Mp_GB_SS_20050300_S99D]
MTPSAIDLPTKSTTITWEKLPDDFILPDEPVDNNLQPLLAAALRESLELAGLILESMLIASNFGLCATRRSYTPHLEGEIPAIVLEFISETEGGEYSIKPKTGELDVYCLVAGKYEQQLPDENNRYWIKELNLFIGIWQGSKAEFTINWLRWWDKSGNLLLWGSELVEQEKQRAEQEKQRAEQEKQRAEQEKLRAEQEKQLAEQEKQRAEQEKQRAEQEKQRAERLASQLRALGVDIDDSL